MSAASMATRADERTRSSPQTGMPLRQLGTLAVPAIGLGCMGMSAHYGPTDERQALATIDRALELGCSFVDTAEFYGPYTNEELVGRALAGRRDRVVLSTKFGVGPKGLDGSAENVRRSIEGSLDSPEVRLCRPLLPPSSRSRARRSRTPWGRWPSWSPRARFGTSG